MSENEPRHEQRLKRGPAQVIQEAYGAPHITAETANFPYHLAAHRAHVVMLIETGIIPKDSVAILRALDDLESKGADAIPLLPELNDLFTCTEVYLVHTLGDAMGGRLHTGRSRNDLFMGLERMADRDAINRVIEDVLALQSILLERAEEHADIVIPGYTHHSQQAQPITFGHFLLGHHDILQRDIERLEAAYSRTNRSPFGGAALAGTGFPIDRERVAELLGFDGLVEHTADACGSRDFQLEIAAALAIIGSNLGRMVESLILYTSSEFGYVELADEFASISSIMPQKKNPVSLEIVEAFGARSIGHLSSILSILKSSTLGMSRETGHCDGELAALVRDTTWALKISSGAVATLRVRLDRATACLEVGLSTVTELADMLVRKRGLSFRQAHKVVGKAVAIVVDSNVGHEGIASDLINKIGRELLGLELNVSNADVREALDPRLNVDVRATRGGPAPREVRRMVQLRREWARGNWVNLENRCAALQDADRRLRSAVAALAG